MLFRSPDGVEAGQFGEFPGAYTSRGVLLSANKGNGKWVPVFFSFNQGFKALDEMDAEWLIPFSVRSVAKDESGNTRWISGFIVVRDKSENGCRSLFYTVDENGSLAKEPIAQYANKALSAAANPDRPGTLTVHFEAYRAGNVTEEYSFEKQEWTSVNVFGTFDEIVWIN